MTTELNVAILLATYNGEKFLRQQLDSILNQNYCDFSLYISDDNSSDSTLSIIIEYLQKDSRIHLLPKHKSKGSACCNFLHLLENVESDIYLLCDQDDLWTPDHVSSLVNAYITIENNTKQPVLVHGDLTVVDEDLTILDKSFLRYTNLPHVIENKHSFFVQNNVTGCASLVNKVLKEYVFSSRDFLYQHISLIPMHDCFFATIAKYFGTIRFVKKQIVFYRQHSLNVVGAKKCKGMQYLVERFFKMLRNQNNVMLEINKNMNYAFFFCENFKKEISKSEYEILKQFSNIRKKNKLMRIFFILKHKFIKHGFHRNIKLFISI